MELLIEHSSHNDVRRSIPRNFIILTEFIKVMKMQIENDNRLGNEK